MKNQLKRFCQPALGLMFVLTLGLGACAMEQKHRDMAEDLIAGAQTKSDHEAIAVHYEQQAQEASDKMELMRKHLESYSTGSTVLIPKQKEYFIQHCNSLINKYNEIALENQELAKLHHEVAAGM